MICLWRARPYQEALPKSSKAKEVMGAPAKLNAVNVEDEAHSNLVQKPISF